MQFIAGGPDIPEALLQAHEDGRVIFFCGAGISYPAGLPDFRGLVESIYSKIGTDFSKTERLAFERAQYDVTLDLLERRLPGQRKEMREVLAQVLKPKLRRKGAIDTQLALLRLARNRAGTLRLVTTNFDHVFHKAAKRINQKFEAYAAPMLPVPKNSRWDGVVYLHGILPKKSDEVALNRLVVTSGDFGLAYLTERWAARFVSELFRNYAVCFVGYAINDPVLRYMMDALAADRMLGEVTPQAWALGGCKPGEEDQAFIEWKSKGVTPILYNTAVNGTDHSGLHRTLCAWASIYRDGTQGKESIVVKYAMAAPQASTQQDNFIARMLWAISDKSGLPAKRFADSNPVPTLDWFLEVFSRRAFSHNDLIRFDVPAHDDVDTELSFSLLSRPASYRGAPWMLLASGGDARSRWDDVMMHLARWLTRHLDDPRLIIWIAQQGGQLHDHWASLIERELERLASLEREGNTAELDEIRSHAPKAVPSPVMKKLWHIVLSGRLKSSWNTFHLRRWLGHLNRTGLTASLRFELREALKPCVNIRAPIPSGGRDLNEEKVARVNQLVDWEIVLSIDHARSTIKFPYDEKFKEILPYMLEDFQYILRDALDLFRDLREGDNRHDQSHWDLPSIERHGQSRGFHDWVSLIELLRDAWLEVRANDDARATRVAQAWFELPYPTFKRLALFAASHENCIPPEQWVEWLLADDALWLWSPETKREVCRLLVLQGCTLAGEPQERLEAIILAGPPHEDYPDDLMPEHRRDDVSRAVWLRLVKLKASGTALGALSEQRLIQISADFPGWTLSDHKHEEFSRWMSVSGDPDNGDDSSIDVPPRSRQELVEWLKNTRSDRRFNYEDKWRDVCRERMFHCLMALSDLASTDMWPVEPWSDALQAWSADHVVKRSWRCAAPLVFTMRDNIMQKLVHSVAWWLDAASMSINIHEDIFLELCDRVLNMALETVETTNALEEPADRPVDDAINHPFGLVTRALLNLWFQKNPQDGDGLPPTIKPFFTRICDVQAARFRPGRVLLGSRLIALFRGDRQWTEQHLLPLFSWDNPVEAKAVWEGFLWSPRLYGPLLEALKPQLLDTPRHYAELIEHRDQFATFITYAALERSDGYTVEEFRTAISSLPQDGLVEAARALSQALEGSASQREEYWRNRVQPFWHDIWPKFGERRDPRMVRPLARMAIASGKEFPSALDTIQDWIQPIESPDIIVSLLSQSGLCSEFPQKALTLLNKTIGIRPWDLENLEKCLNEIGEVDPRLLEVSEYKRLHGFLLK
ncbi:SIR2 family protein [Tistrella mobilis]|uniref:anti-phage defense-associated sirtuin Dsr1 n=1 Tax=Tistrella mobilis TaxID=171437 RepID=UPI0035584261